MFLILEYCSGNSLEDRISKKEEKPKNEKIKICSQIISALKFCNDMSIAHLDIKTLNILFDNNGRVKVADFGLSLFIDPNENFSEFRGSLTYASPEICKKISYDPFKSDIWSFGVLFYRLFTYTYPFEGKTKQDVINRIIDGYYPEKIHCSIGKVIRRMLVVSPEEPITIKQLYEMEMFSPVSTNTSPSTQAKFGANMNKFQRSGTRRISGISSSFSSNMYPNPVPKCISVHESRAFLTSPNQD